MVIEAVPGKPVAALIRDRALSLTDSLALAIQLTALVNQLHAAKIIHKNIHPAIFLWSPETALLTLLDQSVATTHNQDRVISKEGEITTAALSYLAPEQTGRMNRAVDYRCDFYSLGVFFYELFTGRLPFTATDPLELVYCHIAKRPLPPEQLNPDLPPVLSDIIMKLMAKNADERYQSAAGLKVDLERCLRELLATDRIEPFVLAKNDISSVFHIPQKLYGREQEVGLLLEAFRRVSEGATEAVSITGYSGVGKTALVQELHGPITARRGYFIAGKFDQLQRNIPYLGWIQAFRELVHCLLMEKESQLASVKEAILLAVEQKGKALTDVISDLELIIGRQPDIPELSPAGTQFRFNSVFERFIKAVANARHPLVVFLDDLQWIDPASLKLLETIITFSDAGHLLLIISYRDNEVDPAHPLLTTLNTLKKSGAILQSITLQPLAADDIGNLLADTLGTDRQRVLPLTLLLYEKTAGNPFFVNHFLTMLHDEKLVAFNRTNHQWQWDIGRITAKGYTDNVADLMIGKLRKLAGATQQQMKIAACVGNRFDLETLAVIGGESEASIHETLRQALGEGMIMQLSDTSFAFLHDRVQQAAYSLIPEEQRAGLHLQIGRLLLPQISDLSVERALFDVIGHLNYGAALLVDQAEKYCYARQNLLAGKKAQASMAYSSAAGFYSSGASFLASASWQEQHDLSFALYAGLAECSFQMGDPDEAKRLCGYVLTHAETNAERVTIYLLKIDLLTTIGEIISALLTGVECLHLLGVDIPLCPTNEQVRAEEELFDKLIADRQIEDLLDLPEANDPDIIAALEILSIMHPPSHFIPDRNLYLLIPVLLCNLSLKHGNAPASAFAYGDYATLATGNGNNAYRFGKVACQLVERFDSTAYRAKVYFMMGGVIAQFFEPLAIAQKYLNRCFQAALESGDIPFAGFARIDTLVQVFIKGEPLDEVYQESENCLAFARKVKFDMIVVLAVCRQRLILALRGQTNHLGSFDDATFSETAFEEQIRGNIHDFCWYQISKLLCRFYAGDYPGALLAQNEIKDRQFLILAEPVSIEYYFFAALTLVACSERAGDEERQAFAPIIAEYHLKLEIWAGNCPETFWNLSALVAAEIARLAGRDTEAMQFYEEAIRSARENGFVQHEALAYELAATFWLNKGYEDFARLYMIKAHERYECWGAIGKARALATSYPQWLKLQVESQPSADQAQRLDLLTVMKAAQAISSELELQRLLDRLLQILIENAGAERGVLLLRKNEQWVVEAQTSTAAPHPKVSSMPFADCRDLPHAIINIVQRSGQSVLLNDASREGKYTFDPNGASLS